VRKELRRRGVLHHRFVEPGGGAFSLPHGRRAPRGRRSIPGSVSWVPGRRASCSRARQ
jgi:hypothetical protein